MLEESSAIVEMRQPVAKPCPKPDDTPRAIPSLPETKSSECRHLGPLDPIPSQEQMHEHDDRDRPED